MKGIKFIRTFASYRTCQTYWIHCLEDSLCQHLSLFDDTVRLLTFVQWQSGTRGEMMTSSIFARTRPRFSSSILLLNHGCFNSQRRRFISDMANSKIVIVTGAVSRPPPPQVRSLTTIEEPRHRQRHLQTHPRGQIDHPTNPLRHLPCRRRSQSPHQRRPTNLLPIPRHLLCLLTASLLGESPVRNFRAGCTNQQCGRESR